jgi:hypothetical protein
VQKALDLIEAGPLPHRHSQAAVVVDDAQEAEAELSFFDYQHQSYIGESGLSPEPFFFPARKRTLADGRAGYVVGPEVTRFLRHDARFGVACREARLGDVRCKVRTYAGPAAAESAIGFGLTEKPSRQLSSSPPPPTPVPEPSWCDKSGGAASTSEPLESSGLSPGSESPEIGPRRATPSTAMLAATTAAVLAIAAMFPLLGLMGIIGWETTPEKVSFEELPGGEFSPRQADVSLRRAWYVREIERLLFPRHDPFVQEGAPDWLKLESDYYEATGSRLLRISPSGAADRTTEGEHSHRLELRFPLASRTYDGTAIILRVGHAAPKLAVSPNENIVFTRSAEGVFSPAFETFEVRNAGTVSAKWRVFANVDWLEIVSAVDGRANDALQGNLGKGEALSFTIRPNRDARRLQNGDEGVLTIENVGASERVTRNVRIAVASRPTPPAPAEPPQAPRESDADLACDELAANRFDIDRPAGRPFVVDTGALTDDDIERGVESCHYAERAIRDKGAHRRFAVQLGRLYAERAIREAQTNSLSDADADMRKAHEIWQKADREGSGYAARLLGALFGGEAYKVGGRDFVSPDDNAAAEFFERAMKRRDVIGKRNYAARLLNGKGVDANVGLAINLLREAMKEGDETAAGVLGVALYDTRNPPFPPHIPKDQEEGWELMKRTYCIYPNSRNMIGSELRKGKYPESERPKCR